MKCHLILIWAVTFTVETEDSDKTVTVYSSLGVAVPGEKGRHCGDKAISDTHLITISLANSYS